MSDYGIVNTTTDSAENARKISDHLLREKLAGCIQTTRVTSTYVWEGEVRQAEEQLLTIKTASHLYEKVAAAIKSVHNYETPEIVFMPITKADRDYVAWLRSSVLQKIP